MTVLRTRGSVLPWLYLGPLIVSLVVWVYGPMVWTGILSTLDWDLISPRPEFVGVGNFVDLLTRPESANALLRTGYYVLGMLPFATVVPMGLAIMLWRRPGRAAEIYRALLFAPVVLAPVAVAVAWLFLLNPVQGLVNTVLGTLARPTPNWLGDPATALPTVVVITSAKVVALNMLLFSAALAGLDRRAVDAARIEGATQWETTRHIVVPQLARTTVLLTLLCVVVAGQWVFTTVSVLTQGGPDGTTDNVYHRLYLDAFEFFDAGTAAAAAMTVMVGLAVAFGLGARLTRGAAGAPDSR